jgi:hypothetical protein
VIDASVRRYVQVTSRPRGMSNHGGEARDLAKRSKGCGIHLHAPLLLTYHALYIEGYENHIQNGSHDYHGTTSA